MTEEKRVFQGRWVMIIMGAVMSSFVGTMYGYSYLKDSIKELWRNEASTIEEMKSGDSQVMNGYYMGFLGQYLAIIPGIVFDNFGAAVTLWYGAACCGTGFLLVGLSASWNWQIVLLFGTFFAGQGSKALGFGALLGTVAAVPDSWASVISGIYLCLDACSAVLAMATYKGIFEESSLAPKWKVFGFFLTLAVVILSIGIISGVVYFFLIRKNKLAEEAEEAATRGSAANNRRSSRVSRSSLGDEAQLVSKDDVKEAEADEETPLVGSEEKKQKTFVMGVICCFFVLFLGEAQGLAFNGLIGDTFVADRHAKVGMRSIGEFIESKNEGANDFHHPFHTDLHDKAKDGGEFSLKSTLEQLLWYVPKNAKIVQEHAGQPVLMFTPDRVPSAGPLMNKVDAFTHHYELKNKDGKYMTIEAKDEDTDILVNCKDPVDNLRLGDMMETPAKNLGKGLDVFTRLTRGGCKISGTSFGKKFAEIVHEIAPAKGFKWNKEHTKLFLITEDIKENEDLIKGTHKAVVGPSQGFEISFEIFAADSNNGVAYPKFSKPRDDSGDELVSKFVLIKYNAFAKSFIKLSPIQLEGKGIFPFRNFVHTLRVEEDGLTPVYYEPKDAAIGINPESFKNVHGTSLKFQGAPSTPMWYNEKAVYAHKKDIKAAKLTLAITFALCNAIGRLSFGFLSDLGVKVTHWMPCAFWMVFGILMYVFLYGVFGYTTFPSTSYNEDGVPEVNKGTAALYALTALVGIAFGGVFTINTAYMKKIVAKEKLGVVLGASLVVLAIGSFIFGKVLCGVHGHSEIDGDNVSTIFNQGFFRWGTFVNIVALPPAIFCWYSQAKELAAEKAKEFDSEEVEN